MKKILFFLIASLLTGSVSLANAKNRDSITYIDGRYLVDVILHKGVEEISAVRPEWGITSLRHRFRGVTEETRVQARLPKMHKRRLSAEDMYAKSSQGVLMVGRFYDCGRCPDMHTVVSATAVALTEDGLCVTNHHVVAPFLSGRPRDTLNVDSVAFVGTKDGRVYPIIEVLTYSETADLAIIRVDTRGDKLTPIPLGNPPYPGARVRTITHPSGHYYYYTEGVVARNSENRSRGVMSRRMEITAEYAVGSSGGPIFDEGGNLVGLVSSTSSIESGNQRHQMAVKNTIPVELSRRLLL